MFALAATRLQCVQAVRWPSNTSMANSAPQAAAERRHRRRDCRTRTSHPPLTQRVPSSLRLALILLRKRMPHPPTPEPPASQSSSCLRRRFACRLGRADAGNANPAPSEASTQPLPPSAKTVKQRAQPVHLAPYPATIACHLDDHCTVVDGRSLLDERRYHLNGFARCEAKQCMWRRSSCH